MTTPFRGLGKLVSAVALTTLVVGCASGGYSSRDSLEDEKELSALVSQSLNAYNASDNRDCNDRRLVVGRRSVETLEGRLHAIYSAAFDRSRSMVERQVRQRQLQELRPFVLHPKLELADTYLRAKCFEDARAEYREILETYPGTSYAGYRERATAGLIEVAAKDRR